MPRRRDRRAETVAVAVARARGQLLESCRRDSDDAAIAALARWPVELVAEMLDTTRVEIFEAPGHERAWQDLLARDPGLARRSQALWAEVRRLDLPRRDPEGARDPAVMALARANLRDACKRNRSRGAS